MYYYYSRQTIEEGWNRRQGKGRRVGKGGKICLIPCRARCFASVYLEEAVNSAVYLELTVRDTAASAAKNWTHFAPQTDTTTFAFASLSILLLWGKQSFYVVSSKKLSINKMYFHFQVLVLFRTRWICM